MSVSKEEIDDLDDLDDLLDDFDESALPPMAGGDGSADSAAHTTAAKASTEKSGNALPNLGPDDFARQLQTGMEDLMKELDTSPEARADFEQLMAQMNAATIDTAPGSGATSSYPNNADRQASAAASSIKTPKNFQESIEANLQRMRDSETNAQDAAAPGGELESDAFMAEMMKQFQDSAGGEGDFSKVLEGMMAQLMSKEILYEPLLELHGKYPGWIAAHPDDARIGEYKAQAALVKEIIEKFEDREYRDEDAAKKEEVMTLMGKMQELGSPPAEIMGEDLGMFDPSNKMPTDGDCVVM